MDKYFQLLLSAKTFQPKKDRADLRLGSTALFGYL